MSYTPAPVQLTSTSSPKLPPGVYHEMRQPNLCSVCVRHDCPSCAAVEMCLLSKSMAVVEILKHAYTPNSPRCIAPKEHVVEGKNPRAAARRFCLGVSTGSRLNLHVGEVSRTKCQQQRLRNRLSPIDQGCEVLLSQPLLVCVRSMWFVDWLRFFVLAVDVTFGIAALGVGRYRYRLLLMHSPMRCDSLGCVTAPFYCVCEAPLSFVPSPSVACAPSPRVLTSLPRMSTHGYSSPPELPRRNSARTS